MKRSFPVLSLAGALFVAAGALPALAQSKADIVNDPASISYSWGVLHTSNDGPQVAYTWSELNRKAPESAQASAHSQGATGAPIRDLTPYEPFVGRSYVAYSWGVISTPEDGPQIAYTWDELRRLK